MYKKLIIVMLIIMTTLLLAACGGSDPAPTETPPTVPPTLPAIEQPIATFCDNVNPSQLRLNTMGLPYSWQANCVPETPYDASQPPGPKGMPEHIQINFGVTNPADKQPGDPVIYIMPAEAYKQMWEDAGSSSISDTMENIKTIISTQQNSSVPSSGNPVLPVEEVTGHNDLAVQGTYLSLGDWEGYRFIGRFGQDANPVTNQNLRYMFQGFAGENDEFFVAFFYPVSTPYLPDTTADVSAEEMNRFNNDTQAYMTERAEYLNALDKAYWNPMPSLLDQVLASLEYAGADTNEPIPTVEPPTPEPQLPYGEVIAPDGVNIRTGSGTDYPIIGLVRFGSTIAITGKSADGLWWVTPIQSAPNNQGWVSAPYIRDYNTDGVPVVQPPAPTVPTAVPTAPATPSPSVNFWADRDIISEGECTTLRWQAHYIQAIWVYPVGEPYQDYPVTGEGSRQVCPGVTTTYEMRVQHRDGRIETQQVTINVSPGNPLANSRWVVSSLNVNQVPLPDTSMTIYFSAANTVNGDGSCNTFNGPYSVIGASIAIGPLSSTQALCSEDIGVQETAYFQALQSATSYELSGSQLILKNAGGQEVARFNRTG